MDVGGHLLKRVVFPSAHQASQVATRLRAFGGSGLYPELLLEREREVWVEYIEGEPVRAVTPEVVAALANWLAELNLRAPWKAPLCETSWPHALRVDLDFLCDVGVLDPPSVAALAEFAERIAPEAVWLGHDCSDFILKNFVRLQDGRVRAVDVESLGTEELLGWGAAKASLRWLGPERERFLALLDERGAPDYRSYFAYVELAFVAFWTKSSYLEGKSRFVDREHLLRFIRCA